MLNNDEQFFSNLLPILIGVPQDSVLGPFLFLVCINDLPNPYNSQMILYADDSAIICTENNFQNLENKSKNKLCKIENWIKLNTLTLNYKKSN